MKSNLAFIVFFFIVVFSCKNLYSLSKEFDELNIAQINDSVEFQLYSNLIDKLLPNQTTEALDYSNRLMVLANRTQKSDFIAQSHYHYAKVLLSIDEYDNALFHFLKAYKIFESRGDTLGLAQCLNNLGTIYFYYNDTESAKKSYFSAYYHIKLINENKYEPEILYNLALVLSKENQLDSAFAYFKVAELFFSQSNNQKGIIKVQIGIGETNLNIGNYSMALNQFEKALKKDSLLSISEIGYLHTQIAKIYIQQKKIEIAKSNIDKCLKLAQKHNLYRIEEQSYYLLAQIDSILLNNKRAYSNLMKSNLILKKINQSDRLSKIAQMQGIYSSEAKQREIEKLKNENLFKSKENAFQRNITYLFIFLIILAIALVLVLLTDSKARRKLYYVLVEKNKKLFESQKELESLSMTKDKFFGIVAHEIKNPFVNIIGVTDFLNEKWDTLPEEKKKILIAALKENSIKGFKLLENLNIWSRAQLGQIVVNKKLNSLSGLVNEELFYADKLIRKKSLLLINQIDTDVLAYFDFEMIRTVFRNILLNAIKFTFENGRIIVEINSGQTQVILSVTDNGIGVPKEYSNKLLSIETQYIAKGTNFEEGTGLGLIISKDYIEKNGGQLWFESEEGKGCTFYFSLPKVSQI